MDGDPKPAILDSDIWSGKKKYPGDVYYVSSDINDKVSDLNVVNVYIGNGFLLQYFFKSIVTDNLFMTLTDLNNNIIKN